MIIKNYSALALARPYTRRHRSAKKAQRQIYNIQTRAAAYIHRHSVREREREREREARVGLVINEKYFGSARNNSAGAVSIIKAIIWRVGAAGSGVESLSPVFPPAAAALQVRSS